MIVTSNGVHVELEDLGEGLSGEYNDEDTDDEPLLRFTVTSGEDFEPIEDASYCTRISADTDLVRQGHLASMILNEVLEPVLAGKSIKKLCERLSWIDGDGNWGN